MSRRDAALEFDAIHIEGGLLPAEWLASIAALKAAHQSPGDYGIPKGLNLRDEVGRYWRIAQAHWSEFANAREHAEDPHGLASRFTQALMRDVFGATDLQPHAAPVEIGERLYPITASAAQAACRWSSPPPTSAWTSATAATATVAASAAPSACCRTTSTPVMPPCGASPATAVCCAWRATMPA